MCYPGIHVWQTTLTLTEKQQEKVQFYENSWIRSIEVVKRADKRRMEELRVTVGMNESFKKKFVRSMLIWTGHVERMGDGKLAKRSVTPIVERKNRK